MDGKKNDTGKLPLELLPLDAIEAEAEVLQFGASKYEARNWEKGMRWGRLYGAVLRHLFAWWRGEARDPETGLSHLAHAACCIHFLLAYEIRKVGEDDRPLPTPTIANPDDCEHEWQSRARRLCGRMYNFTRCVKCGASK